MFDQYIELTNAIYSCHRPFQEPQREWNSVPEHKQNIIGLEVSGSGLVSVPWLSN